MNLLPRIITLHQHAKKNGGDSEWFFSIGAALARPVVDGPIKDSCRYGEISFDAGPNMLAFCGGFTLGDQERTTAIECEGWNLRSESHRDGVKRNFLSAGFPAPKLHLNGSHDGRLFDVFHVQLGDAARLSFAWLILKSGGILIVSDMWNVKARESARSFFESHRLPWQTLGGSGIAFVEKQ